MILKLKIEIKASPRYLYMLLPYQNAIRTLELNYNTTINNKLINDLSNKINITDSNSVYITPYQFSNKTFDTSFFSNQLKNKINYASKNSILIDDREDTIDEFNKAGGTGILFKNNAQEIIKIFDAREKIVLEREFWIEILRLQIEYGLNLNEKILENYERAKLKVNLESIAKRAKVISEMLRGERPANQAEATKLATEIERLVELTQNIVDLS